MTDLPIYILSGKEAYLIDKIKKELVSGLSNPEMNYTKATSVDEELIHLIQTIPFFDDYRVVLIEVCNVKSLGSWFEKYIENPIPTTKLIVVGGCDKNTKVYKQLNKHGYYISCDFISDENKLKSILNQEIKNRGGIISDSVLSYFLNRENYKDDENISILNLISDLERLISYQNQITEETVNLLIKENLNSKVFQVIKYIKSYDIENLNKQAKVLTQDGEQLAAIGALLYSYKKAFLCNYFTNQEIGISQYQRNDFKEISELESLKGIEFLVKAYNSKVNGVDMMPDNQILYYVFFELANLHQQGGQN